MKKYLSVFLYVLCLNFVLDFSFINIWTFLTTIYLAIGGCLFWMFIYLKSKGKNVMFPWQLDKLDWCFASIFYVVIYPFVFLVEPDFRKDVKTFLKIKKIGIRKPWYFEKDEAPFEPRY